MTPAFPSRRFVDLLRELYWLGDAPPPAAPPGWNEAAELQDLRAAWRNLGRDAERVERAMRGFRALADRGELPGTAAGEAFTGALLKRLRGEGFWERAERAGQVFEPGAASEGAAPPDLVGTLAGRIGHG